MGITVKKLIFQHIHLKRTLALNIVRDRYVYSGVAFSAAKNLPIEWCKAPDSGLIQTVMTFYLTGPIEKLSQRGDFRKEIQETLHYKIKLEAFLINQHFYKIDELRSIDEIQAETLSISKRIYQILISSNQRNKLFIT